MIVNYKIFNTEFKIKAIECSVVMLLEQERTVMSHTYKISMLLSPQKAPSISFVTPFLCIFRDFKAPSPWNVSPSTFLILFRFSSLRWIL